MFKKFNLRTATEYVVATTVLFVLFFSPPVIKTVNVVLFLSVLSVLYLLIKYSKRPKDFLKLIKDSGLSHLILIFVSILLLLAITVGVDYLNGVALDNPRPYITSAYRILLICPAVVVIIISFLDYAKRRGWSFLDVAQLIIVAFVLQALIGIAALALPSIKDFLVSIMASNTGNPVFDNEFEVQRRFYGFANTLLDPYGYALGVMSFFAIAVAYLKRSVLLLVFSLLFLFTAAINSRTGLVVFALAVLLMFVYGVVYAVRHTDRVRGENVAKNHLIKIAVVSVIVLSLSAFAIGNSNLTALKSTTGAIKGYVSFVLGETGSSRGGAAPLFIEQYWYLPDNPKTMAIGAGHAVVGTPSLTHADPGYVNDIFAFGILGSLLLYIAILSPSLKLLISKDKRHILRLAALVMILSFLVYNLKGLAVSANQGLIVILLVPSAALLLPLNGKRRG